MVWFLIIDFPQNILTMIITSSVCFAEIIRHCIVLCYLLIVLRLLCLLKGILTGKKIRLLFRQINWQLTLYHILSLKMHKKMIQTLQKSSMVALASKLEL